MVPGELLSGAITRKIGFPQWLGRNSTRSKHSRLEQELHAHTRLAASGSRLAFSLDYLRPLRDALARPLLRGDVAAAVEVMQAYHLMRTDVDSIMDIGVWSHEASPWANVAPKVRATAPYSSNPFLFLVATCMEDQYLPLLNAKEIYLSHLQTVIFQQYSLSQLKL